MLPLSTDSPSKMFHSFKKVLREAGPTFDDVMLISFNSSSKGFFGECVAQWDVFFFFL